MKEDLIEEAAVIRGWSISWSNCEKVWWVKRHLGKSIKRFVSTATKKEAIALAKKQVLAEAQPCRLLFLIIRGKTGLVVQRRTFGKDVKRYREWL